MKTTKLLVASLTLFILSACGSANDVAVTGGTENTVDVNVCLLQSTNTLDGRDCLRQVCGTTVRAGSCTDPTLIYDPILNILDMNVIRDFAVLPCTAEEREFLTPAICGT